MGDTVFINGRAVVHRTSAGSSTAFPDVCFCPPPPPAGPVPTPLANTVTGATLQDGAATVFVEGNPIAVADSYFESSSGNELAKPTGGGVLNGATNGPARFVSYSSNVLIEGKGVPRHLDLLVHNLAGVLSNAPPGVWMSVAAAPSPEDVARIVERAANAPTSSEPEYWTGLLIEPGVYECDDLEALIQGSREPRPESNDSRAANASEAYLDFQLAWTWEAGDERTQPARMTTLHQHVPNQDATLEFRGLVDRLAELHAALSDDGEASDEF